MIDSFPDRAYFICCDARTGSSLLAASLRQTQLAGKPFEYFGGAEIDKPWMRGELRAPADLPFTGFRDWRDFIVKAGSEYNGVFAATVHWFQLGHAVAAFRRDAADAASTPVATLRAFFPKLRLIWLRRDNIVAQAISHYVAISTNVWSRKEGRASAGGPTDHLAPYDFDRIDWQVKSAIVATEGWRETLAEAGAAMLPLTYEQLSGDLEATIRRVFDHLELSLGERSPPPPALLKQAGAWSLDLERRYREERLARGLGPVGDEARL